MTYASLNLPLPRSVQSDKWAPHAAVALAVLGATDDTSAVNLSTLTDRMSVLAGEPVARPSSTRGAWVMDKAGHLLATRKGWYALSESGVEYARRIMGGAAPPSPEVEVAPAPEAEVAKVAVAVEAPEVEVAPAPVAAPATTKEAGVSWLPPVTVGAVDALYDEDEYLLALSVEQTPCFGTYSTRAEACGVCPIAGACSNMLITRMAQVSATLAKRDEEARKAAEARKVEEARLAALRKEEERKAAERAAVESILGNTPTPAPAAPSNPFAFTPAPVSTPAPVPVSTEPVKYTEITAAFPGVCSGCKGKIGKGDTVRYVGGKGMYHPGCVA